MISKTPPPPYYTVIFTSIRSEGDNGYSDMSKKMNSMVKNTPGFLGVENARGSQPGDIGITVSYWKDIESIKAWRANPEHKIARTKGRTEWYSRFKVRIAKVERDY